MPDNFLESKGGREREQATSQTYAVAQNMASASHPVSIGLSLSLIPLLNTSPMCYKTINTQTNDHRGLATAPQFMCWCVNYLRLQ